MKKKNKGLIITLIIILVVSVLVGLSVMGIWLYNMLTDNMHQQMGISKENDETEMNAEVFQSDFLQVNDFSNTVVTDTETAKQALTDMQAQIGFTAVDAEFAEPVLSETPYYNFYRFSQMYSGYPD